MPGKVYCRGCPFLFLLDGEGSPPLCLATAEFVSGPLRPRIDVRGIVLAEVRNVDNDCQYRRSISWKAGQLKDWILRRMPDEQRARANEARLKTYPYEQEKSSKEGILRGAKRIPEYTGPSFPEEVEDPEESEDSRAREHGSVFDDGESGGDSVGGPEGPDEWGAGEKTQSGSGLGGEDILERDDGDSAEQPDPDSGVGRRTGGDHTESA